jgi:hypothetical protein
MGDERGRYDICMTQAADQDDGAASLLPDEKDEICVEMAWRGGGGGSRRWEGRRDMGDERWR